MIIECPHRYRSTNVCVNVCGGVVGVLQMGNKNEENDPVVTAV